MRKATVRAAALAVVFMSSVTLEVWADEPLPPPHRHTRCSPSGKACVTSDPEEGTFGHLPGAADSGARRWSLSGWHRVMYLADDGEHLVTGHEGINLVPLRKPLGVEILAFWRRGKAVRAYRLSDLVASKKSLQRTASHYRWGSYEGFDAAGDFHVSTVEGVVLVFSPKTGEVLRREPPAGPRGNEASGSFAPSGPPSMPPVKVEAGKSCIVDLEQPYVVLGTLSGTFTLDYRILISGPCGAPPGTFDEEWIAHGTFTGTVNGATASGNLSYVAAVSAGGDVKGRMVLGQGLEGELEVRGNFGDRELSYRGSAEEGR